MPFNYIEWFIISGYNINFYPPTWENKIRCFFIEVNKYLYRTKRLASVFRYLLQLTVREENIFAIDAYIYELFLIGKLDHGNLYIASGSDGTKKGLELILNATIALGNVELKTNVTQILTHWCVTRYI